MGDYIFKSSSSGDIEFVGDFESLYLNESDPWGQSGVGCPVEMQEYYRGSRSLLVETILKWLPSLNCEKPTIVEFGTGTGYVIRKIQESLPSGRLIGIDISQTAISKAKILHGNQGIEFYVESVTKDVVYLRNSVDIAVVSNLLWYVLDDLESMFSMLLTYLRPNGILIIQNAFFKQGQLYGRDVIDGYPGFVSYFSKLIADHGCINRHEFRLFSDVKMHHSDGMMILQLMNN